MNNLRISGIALILALAACATAPEESAGHGESSFSFAVIGDIPYGPEDDVALQGEILPRLKGSTYPFVVHVGDYKSGGAPCTEELDAAMTALIGALSPRPVFYTPGDNEWTDCDRNPDPATGKPMSELGRLGKIRALFFATPASSAAELRPMRFNSLPENQTWRYRGVRFVTLHVVGTNNGRSWVTGDGLDAAAAAADARDAANLQWLMFALGAAIGEKADALVIAMQADMTDVHPSALGKPCTDVKAAANPCDGFLALRAGVRYAAEEFGRPVLLIHGDTEPFTLDQEFLENAAPNLWRLNAAGDVHFHEGAWHGLRDVTVVTIDPGASPPFSAKGLVSETAPSK